MSRPDEGERRSEGARTDESSRRKEGAQRDEGAHRMTRGELLGAAAVAAPGALLAGRLAGSLPQAQARGPAWQGVDYSQKVLRPRSKAPQDYTVFTYDDWQSGQPHGPYPTPPNHVVSIRERRWKVARYYDTAGHVPPQWECYDLQRDPLERRNLGDRGVKLTPEQQREFKRLKRKLALVERTRLAPLPTTPS